LQLLLFHAGRNPGSAPAGKKFRAGWPDWANWEIVYFGQFLFSLKSSTKFWATYFHGKSCIKSKMGWATFWALFSKKHPVTLLSRGFF
jgi:hypothetical protein